MTYNPYLMAMVGPAVEREAFGGSPNVGESHYLYNQYVHMEDDAGMLPGDDPYAEGALGGIPDDDEDILGDLDPDLLDDIEDEVEGSMAINPQWAQLMHEADYGPEGYSEVAMSYMSPVEQVDDLFSPYIIERSGIADFDADEVESMMGDEDLYGMDLDDDIDDDDFDDDEFGGRRARRKRRAARKSARKEHRAARRSARKTHRSKRRAIRKNRGARKAGAGKRSTRPVSVTSQQDDPIEKSSNATVTTQAVPSKRAAGNNGMPGPARHYQAAIQAYRRSGGTRGMAALTKIWSSPMWKRDTRRRRLPSPEAVRLSVDAERKYEATTPRDY